MEQENMRFEQLSAHAGPQELGTQQLVQQIAADVKDLAHLEVELAKAEAKVDLESEVDMAKGMVISAVCALIGVNMLIISAVFALAPQYAWVAALIIGLVLLSISGFAGFFGWQKAEKHPLGITRKTLMEDVQWAKEHLK